MILMLVLQLLLLILLLPQKQCKLLELLSLVMWLQPLILSLLLKLPLPTVPELLLTLRPK